MDCELPLALITGGTSGIGLASARRLADRYRLALIYSQDVARAAEVETEFGDPSRVKTFRIDVASDESVNQGYPLVTTHFAAAPSVLINSAGISRFMQFFVQGRSLSLCQQLMNINFFGTLRIVQKALPSMYSRRKGAIVNLSSIAARGGYRGHIGYAESKAAIECFTRNLAVEVAHRGLSVNCVSPGLVETRMTDEFIARFKQKSINFPLGRAITADEVARVIELLAEAGPAINGQNITVDGSTSLAKEQLEVFGGG